MLFCLILYWPGIFVWFHQDDFAFLGLYPSIHNWHDLVSAIFRPTQHGTWRPLSERVYFIGLQWLFGTPHARPFRIVAFATQFANLALIGAITLRLTRSRLAGFMAPILWIGNAVLVTVMVWDSAYIYALGGLALLSAFWMLLRYIETSELRYYGGMWAIFLSGFLVLEMNFVFPALAAAYTLLCSRAHFRKTLPLFIPSIVFVVADTLLIPKQSTGPYAMHLNLGIFNSLRAYWVMLFEPLNMPIFTRIPQYVAVVGMFSFTIALAGFVLYEAFRRNLLPLFFLCWFAIVIGPVLPFQEHIVDYYPTLPSIGVAMLGAYALAVAFQRRMWIRIAGSVLLVFFLVESVPSAHGGAKWNNDRSYEVKTLVLGAAELSGHNPDKLILLDGVGDQLYAQALQDGPFRFLRVENVFLAPTPAEERCMPQTDLTNDTGKYPLTVGAMLRAMESHGLMVYRYDQGKLLNVTDGFVLGLSALNVADPAKASLLGPTWYRAEGGGRWMPKRASLKMDGPVNGCHRLYVSGFCPASQLAPGPFLMTLSVNGHAFPAERVDQAGEFRFDFPVQAAAEGRYDIIVDLDHIVIPPADGRPLGLVFGAFAIR